LFANYSKLQEDFIVEDLGNHRECNFGFDSMVDGSYTTYKDTREYSLYIVNKKKNYHLFGGKKYSTLANGTSHS
jgi:hypothetical protein